MLKVKELYRLRKVPVQMLYRSAANGVSYLTHLTFRPLPCYINQTRAFSTCIMPTPAPSTSPREPSPPPRPPPSAKTPPVPNNSPHSSRRAPAPLSCPAARLPLPSLVCSFRLCSTSLLCRVCSPFLWRRREREGSRCWRCCKYRLWRGGDRFVEGGSRGC